MSGPGLALHTTLHVCMFLKDLSWLWFYFYTKIRCNITVIKYINKPVLSFVNTNLQTIKYIYIYIYNTLCLTKQRCITSHSFVVFSFFTEQCERTIVPDCVNLGFNETFFPNFFEEQSQSDANQSFVGFFKPESGCHVDLLYFICSLQFPKCSKGHVYQPCRRTCNGNNIITSLTPFT